MIRHCTTDYGIPASTDCRSVGEDARLPIRELTAEQRLCLRCTLPAALCDGLDAGERPGPCLWRLATKGNGGTMVATALFTSGSNEWATPNDFYALLDAEFHFTLDPCATADNAKCLIYYTAEDNGLVQDWQGTVYVNPPYGDIVVWVGKSYAAAMMGATVVMLIPSRTDTRYWHTFVMKAAEVRFVRGRLKFGGAKNSAPFPSAVVVFRPGHVGYPAMSAMERR